MTLTQTIITFSIVVALIGLVGLAAIYRGLRKSEPRHGAPRA